MFIAQVLVGPSIKSRKEIIQIKNNMVKNPNWQEADQLAFYKRGRGVELGATEKQLQLVVRAGLEPGTTRFQVRRPNHSTTLPPLHRSCCFSVCLSSNWWTINQVEALVIWNKWIRGLLLKKLWCCVRGQWKRMFGLSTELKTKGKLAT